MMFRRTHFFDRRSFDGLEMHKTFKKQPVVRKYTVVLACERSGFKLALNKAIDTHTEQTYDITDVDQDQLVNWLKLKRAEYGMALWAASILN